MTDIETNLNKEQISFHPMELNPIDVDLVEFVTYHLKNNNLKIKDRAHGDKILEMAKMHDAIGGKALDLNNEDLSKLTRNNEFWTVEEFEQKISFDPNLFDARKKVADISKNYYDPDTWLKFLYSHTTIKWYLEQRMVIRRCEQLKSLEAKLLSEQSFKPAELALLKEMFAKISAVVDKASNLNYNRHITLGPTRYSHLHIIDDSYLEACAQNRDVILGMLEPSYSDKDLEKKLKNIRKKSKK